MTEEQARKCRNCSKAFTPKNYYQRFCSDLCRNRAFRSEERKRRNKARKAKS